MSAPTSGTADVPTADIHAPNPDLTLNERRCLVDQALILIDQVYVHLPFKRAMHAVDPVQRLKLLRGRLGVLSAREFHNELILIFNDLRDLHTRYILPGSYQGKSAYLPFLIEECYEGEEARYIVSKLMPGFCEANFQVGARVTHWNGVAIERVVALNADRHGGSNAAARQARGLDALTIRPLSVDLPPDEDWVVLRYIMQGEVHETKFQWKVLAPADAPNEIDPTSVAAK